MNFKEMEKQTQGCHTSGKSQGNMNFKVKELSGNFATCPGNLNFLVNVRLLSGNFENTRINSS